MRCSFAPILGFGLLLAACASTPPLQSSPNLTVTDGDSLPAPTQRDLSGGGRASVLGPFDRLSVEVYGIPDLGRTVQADASGRISLPVAGDLNIAGMTPAEVGEEVERRLAAGHVRNPNVNVNLVESVSQVVTVDGEVQEPGLYPVVGRMTLMRAVARAKGTTEFARLSHVVIFRTVEGQRMAALYDLRAIRSGLYQDPEVYANDIVMVGTSQARRLFRDIIQGSGLITTPIIALLQSS